MCEMRYMQDKERRKYLKQLKKKGRIYWVYWVWFMSSPPGEIHENFFLLNHL